MNYNTEEYPLSKIADVEAFRIEMISALNYVGVQCSYNTSIHDLPNLIMKIGGVNTTGWPVNMSSINYNTSDSKAACYRYVEQCFATGQGLVPNYKEILNFNSLVNRITNVELAKSRAKLSEWNNKTTQQKNNTTGMFKEWSGAFVPKIDTTEATTFQEWFRGTGNIVYIPLLNTINVTNMLYAYRDCASIRELPEFDCRNVVNIEQDSGSNGACTYIFGMKNIGHDPSTNTTHTMNSIYQLISFMGTSVYENGNISWWAPCSGTIFKYPIYLYRVQRNTKASGGITNGQQFNVLSMDAIYEYDKNLDIVNAPISANSLENIIDSIRDLSDNPEDVDWVPSFNISSSLYNDSNRWSSTYKQAILDKGWDFKVDGTSVR